MTTNVIALQKEISDLKKQLRELTEKATLIQETVSSNEKLITDMIATNDTLTKQNDDFINLLNEHNIKFDDITTATASSTSSTSNAAVIEAGKKRALEDAERKKLEEAAKRAKQGNSGVASPSSEVGSSTKSAPFTFSKFTPKVKSISSSSSS